MMTDLRLFNGINDLEETGTGLILHRLPKDVRNKMDRQNGVSKSLNGSEIRMQIDGLVTVKLTSLTNNAVVVVYYGDFQDQFHFLKKMKNF